MKISIIIYYSSGVITQKKRIILKISSIIRAGPELSYLHKIRVIITTLK